MDRDTKPPLLMRQLELAVFEKAPANPTREAALHRYRSVGTVPKTANDNEVKKQF